MIQKVSNKRKRYIEGCCSDNPMADDQGIYLGNYIQKTKDGFYNCKDITPENKNTVKDFIQKQEALGIKPRRTAKILSNLKTIFTKIAPDFDIATATEQELMQLSELIKKTDYSDRTKEDFIVIVRRYYKVMEGRNVRMPDKCDFFKVGKRVRVSKGPEDVISREEFAKILSAATNLRDKALIVLLYEGGLRVGELLNLDIRDVKITDDGIELHVPDKPGCKTGPRDIWLTECYGSMRSWVDSHPLKHRPEAPLFISRKVCDGKVQYSRLNVFAVATMLKKKAALAGINTKKIHPHAFRHTCATEKAIMGFMSSQLNAFMGWTPSSQMADVYIHYTGKGVKEAYKKALGLPADEQKALRICPKCKHENSYLAQACGRCGSSLDAKRRLELENSKSKILDRLQHLCDFEPRLEKFIDETNQRFEDSKLGKKLSS